jgi:hypothetical protein
METSAWLAKGNNKMKKEKEKEKEKEKSTLWAAPSTDAADFLPVIKSTIIWAVLSNRLFFIPA